MTHSEIEELLGAYALDAVDADEAGAVEEHLATCPRCRAEVEAHREVAALLTSGSSDPVPEGVWDKIAADLGDTPPPVPLEVAFGRREAKRSRPRGVLMGLAAATALIVIALMGAVLVEQRSDLDDTRNQLENALSADLTAMLADPDTSVVELTGDGDDASARVVVGPDGDSVLLGAGLPELGTGQTYQLWGLPEGQDSMVSLSVLGGDPDHSTFHVEDTVHTLAITREPGGGSPEPTTDPLVTGSIA